MKVISHSPTNVLEIQYCTCLYLSPTLTFTFYNEGKSGANVINHISHHYHEGANVHHGLSISGNARLGAGAITAGVIAGQINEIKDAVIKNDAYISPSSRSDDSKQ